ncbi:flocculation-associated PEP-CTERM protein PepA [Thauera sinica]|uniref:Flocculation-associated PEP-CTERM protein PepA n=1 Tax=Thauera sinica TaxID=2665146 RepID=A0ABW1ANN6_9RHOO|nr:flocculation-associated PEP-CTERM protein PepA [Thauera sp. K11]ATE60510.1 hypothetical protein CCZ27_11635 [Thauera sp. K11]
MKKLALVLALASAGATAPALAATSATWVGTADYGVEVVGPFNTYDFASAGVLLQKLTSATTANTFYQSFVTNHLLDDLLVSNPKLNSEYEITVVANFASTLTSENAFGQTYTVTSGSFALWLDTAPDYNFGTDSGFSNGVKILEGVVIGGAGSNVNFGSGQKFGGGGLQLHVTGFDSEVFDPDTIDGGNSVFTLKLNVPTDSAFLDPIISVQGEQYVASAGDLKYAADGNLILTPVPEPETYSMLLAGLGIIGAIARRRMRD